MSRPLTAAALVAAALAAAAVVRRRLQTQSSGAGDTAEAGGAATDAEESPQAREWRCDCGQEYVVSGVDRHRVYWPAGGSADDALLELRCVECGGPLPATREVTA
jgi:hypothetical protein